MQLNIVDITCTIISFALYTLLLLTCTSIPQHNTTITHQNITPTLNQDQYIFNICNYCVQKKHIVIEKHKLPMMK
jgi:hypothetical protein